MIRKWTMVLVSLMLVLMLPLSAFAQTQHALSIELGDVLPVEQVVTDLFDVLTFKVTGGEKSGALTLTVDGTDIATIGMGADAEALYAYSAELLGDAVLCVNWDDAFTFIKAMIAAQMAEEETAGLGQVLEQIDQLKAQLLLALEEGVQVNTGMLSKEEAMAQVQKTLGDYPEFLAWMEGVYEDLTPEKGVFTAEDRDTASEKYSMTLEKEDFIALMATDYIHATIEKQMQAEDSTLSGDALKEAADKAIAEACAAFEEMAMECTTVVYTVDAGATVVGMELTMKMAEDASSEQVGVTADYKRHTTSAGVTHKGSMLMSEGSATAAEVKLDSLCTLDGACKGIFGMLVDGEEVLVQFGSEEKADNAAERFASLYLRSGATAILEPAASDRPIITFRVSSCEMESAATAALDSASLATSVDIMKMSSEQMEALVNEVSGRAMQVAFTAMSKLPTSVMNLIMGEM